MLVLVRYVQIKLAARPEEVTATSETILLFSAVSRIANLAFGDLSIVEQFTEEFLSSVYRDELMIEFLGGKSVIGFSPVPGTSNCTLCYTGICSYECGIYPVFSYQFGRRRTTVRWNGSSLLKTLLGRGVPGNCVLVSMSEPGTVDAGWVRGFILLNLVFKSRVDLHPSERAPRKKEKEGLLEIVIASATVRYSIQKKKEPGRLRAGST